MINTRNNILQNMIIFGGSFDPPHIGHINIANNILKQFQFDKFIIMPCYQQVLKTQHISSPQDRLAMLKLAFSSNNFVIDTAEITQKAPSYTVNTLKTLRQKYGKEFPITLLIGMDSFVTFDKWHEWKQILNLANLMVVNRKTDNYDLNENLKEIVTPLMTDDPNKLLTSPYGLIGFVDAGDYNISSTELRQMLAESKINSNNYQNFLSKAVFDYIKKHNLYT